ncbi:MAG: hypothetical protein UR66_C0004G0086 [Candidatus Moranbacteria bacterium GW2011_GWE1_35_17]|nr:MAG: hypothetical protein UR65_C0072G0003 [Candidatus Moranbacteria bacterium GW2011_GWE2_35_164]KKP68686.1 MAG: hypothetical protein UR66_C0004G0086 [Candidatus Moranbacteria bacterium GW2011_GWE1_35_17]KKP82925.1 MAG: hypothetical protein UR83_C0042G0005 [Candidatus Moranbacteria bacterium GW2011_GWF2_35_54]KKP84655.1 MAG: hypothetical protein UR82_C0001G0022 [Candidatus Moranbacteria bacterium GW2011_GWF1_35_5]
MIQIILDSLIKYFPEISGYAALVIIASFISIKFYKFYSETKIVCKNHDGINDKLNLLLEKFNSLIVVLGENEAIKNPDMFSTNSPLNLTPKGLAFVSSLGWKNILDNSDKKEYLFKKIDKFNLSSKADVEKYSVVLLNELYASRKENPFTEVKNYLYNDATIERQNAIFACALYLRDEYLKNRPNILK